MRLDCGELPWIRLPSNETSQCRGALAQLLEYRLDYGHPDDQVVVVVDAAVRSRRSEILERLGLATLLATSDGLTSLTRPGGRSWKICPAANPDPTASPRSPCLSRPVDHRACSKRRSATPTDPP
jgi:hypothetical protein